MVAVDVRIADPFAFVGILVPIDSSLRLGSATVSFNRLGT